MKDGPMQRKCNGCGASGWLAATVKPVPPPRVHKNPGRIS